MVQSGSGLRSWGDLTQTYGFVLWSSGDLRRVWITLINESGIVMHLWAVDIMVMIYDERSSMYTSVGTRPARLAT